MSAKLGEILVRENLITSQQLREALDYQRTNGGRLGSNLVKLGFISDDVITAVLSRQYGVPSINLDLFQIEDEVDQAHLPGRRPQILGPADLEGRRHADAGDGRPDECLCDGRYQVHDRT